MLLITQHNTTQHNTTMDGNTDTELIERLGGFYRDYYHGEIAALTETNPLHRALRIDWNDLYQFDPAVADDYLQEPEFIDQHLTKALSEYDLPVDVDLEGVPVRVVGMNAAEIQSPIDVTKQDDPGYVGIRGDLSKVTVPDKELTEGAFECLRCSTINNVPQVDGFQEPHECRGCERQGPFRLDVDASSFDHYCKVRVETPPDESGDIQGQHIDGFVRGRLVWHGHPEYGLVARTGDSATVYGTVTKLPKPNDQTRFDEYLDVAAIEFAADTGSVDIAEHRDEFESLAECDGVVDMFAESIAPELYATPAWESALELLVAYLFGAPRINIPDGPSFRGDIHVLIISDYGMGKSMVNEAVAKFSPKCIKESVTGMSSEVGLLAAAVKDDFGAGQWSLQPGVLVRANGGHVILDEIDKTDVDLERMNDALEGEQVVTVNKAGQSATYKSRVGLLATGNPENARFDSNLSISEQLDIDQSLLSRFDGIVTMEDRPDPDTDAAVAETQGLAYLEAQEYVFGDREELDRLERVVSPEVGRAWIAYARESVHPLISEGQVNRIKEWYAEEVRQLNEEFSEGSGVGGDMPVPVTARVVSGTIRFAVAFARVHLRDHVSDGDVERAMDLAKTLVGQSFDGERFQPEYTRRPDTQQGRVDTILGFVRDHGPINREDLVERCCDAGVDAGSVEHELDRLCDSGVIYRPETGVFDIV